MTNKRADGLRLVLLGSIVLVLFGCALEASSPATIGDFRDQYYPARCLVQHGDPYNQADVMRAYHADRRGGSGESWGTVLMITEYIYPPTAFTFTAPLAALPFGPAHLIWMALSFACLIAGGIAMWDLGSDGAPVLAGALIGFVLANCELIITSGNVAGIAIGLALFAVWCFVRERFIGFGVLCLAASIALKPHDTGLVWFYFLLAGGCYRRRALQTLAAVVALSLPAILWVTHVAPAWVGELRSNVISIGAQGGTEPGLHAGGPSLIIDLQAALSLFSSDPRTCNLLSYCICGGLLLAWCLITIRTEASLTNTWLGLATVGALSMLPVYHRVIDAKLLLLAVPACAMLWRQGGRIARIAAAMTMAALAVTADIPWAIDIAILGHLKAQHSNFAGPLFDASQALPAPLILLADGSFFLWVYFRRERDRANRVIDPIVG